MIELESEEVVKFEKNLNDWRVNHPHKWISTTDRNEAKNFLKEQTNKLVEEQIRSTSEIVASQDRINSNLRRISLELGDIDRGIKELSSKIEWGFTELIWQMEENRKVLQDILETLQAPLDTQAKELRKRAKRAKENGWIEDALEDFLKSEEKNKYDFTIHQNLGDIYFEHKNNLKKALDYYEKAAKYAKPESTFHASFALLNVAKIKYIREEYKDAKETAKEAINLTPDFDLAHFEYARLSLKTEDQDEAIEHLNTCIKCDRYYAVRADSDTDFQIIEKRLEKLFSRLRTQAKKLAKTEIKKTRQYIAEGEKNDAPVTRFRDDLKEARNTLNKNTLFSCLDAADDSHFIRKKVLEETINRLQIITDTMEDGIDETKQKLLQKKKKKQYYLEEFFHWLLWIGAIFLSITVNWKFILIPMLNSALFFAIYAPLKEYYGSHWGRKGEYYSFEEVLEKELSPLGIVINKAVTAITGSWFETNLKEKTQLSKSELPDLKKDLRRAERRLKELESQLPPSERW